MSARKPRPAFVPNCQNCKTNRHVTRTVGRWFCVRCGRFLGGRLE